MDAILENQLFFITEPQESEKDSKFEYEHDVSMWVKENQLIKPSTKLTILQKLEPAVYTVGYSRDDGFYCEKLNIDSDELFVFSDSVTTTILNEIDLFWKKKNLYLEKKLIHKRGILLEGYPGTGKSSIISQVSNAIIKNGGIVFKITSFRNLDDYIQFLRVGFRKIQPETPIVTILEDINQYGEVELELLDFLDGQTSINHHILIATSNDTIEIPDTFLRPSRLDLRIIIDLPSKKTREEFFRFKNIDESLIEELVNKTDGCSLADLKELYICIFLLEYSISDAIKKVTSIRNKKNYKSNPKKVNKIGLE